MNLKSLKTKAKKEIEKTEDLKELDKIWQNYLGKREEISLVFSKLKNLSEKKRKEVGKEANEARKEIDSLIKKKREILSKKSRPAPSESWLDVTLPGKKIKIGNIHPLTKVFFECEEIFGKMGFEVVEGREIENEWYNFDALNIPKDHPARDAWSTLWLKETGDRRQATSDKSNHKSLLRTHTSPAQIHYMEKNNPPFRIIVPGRVFRYEATDCSHEIQFHQLEGLMVDKNISLSNLKEILTEFFKIFFERDIEIRFRPGYFPFTEPSIEADIKFNGRWLEMLGAGMVHPNVFKSAKLNPKNWQGFAFGIGVDRLAMLKYKIGDIRLFYSGDLRFLKQF